MADTLRSRFTSAVNAFRDGSDGEYKNVRLSDTELVDSIFGGRSSSMRGRSYGERTTIASIYTRIALDCAMVDFRHVRLGKNDQFLETIRSGLHEGLTLSSNLDQTATSFKMDLILSLLQEGHVAIVPVDTTLSPEIGSFDVLSMRIGKVTRWYASHVTVDLYNQKTGRHEEITLDKNQVALVENPFYEVMNETNSTLKRMQRKIYLLDAIDEQLGAGKLDLIIQLPYVIKSDARRQQAEQRRKEIEMQLTGAKYGIAYTDGTESITQLNRPAENNLLKQIESLESKLYSELGLTKEIMDGTADAKAMLNYYNRTTAPILKAITEELTRKFISKTARTQGQAVRAMRDPFALVPLDNIAELVDKFTRNEIATSNEMRGVIGWYPSDDPKADELRNSNLSAPVGDTAGGIPGEETEVMQPGSAVLGMEEKRQILKKLLWGDSIKLTSEDDPNKKQKGGLADV